MSAAKHTPGPWSYGIQTGAEDTHIITGPQGRSLIAELSNRSNDTAQIAANARLIAASPELLAALQQLAKCAAVAVENPTDHFSAAMVKAREALAKAGGAA